MLSLTSLSPDIIALLLLLGVFAGVMAGLLGVGGGLIIVPALIFFFEAWQFPETILTQMAVASSLATIVFTSLSSVYAHHKNALVDWPLTGTLTVGIALGAVAGAFVASLLAGNMLRLLFGVFAIGVALQIYFELAPQGARKLPGKLGKIISGFAIALFSAIFGIGGGSLSVPLLTYFGVNIKKSVAVSAACGFPIALFSVLGFIVLGLQEQDLPEGSLGFVFWPAVLIISLASVLSAPLGANLAASLPAKKLKRIFALFLSLVGVRLIVSSL